VWSKGGLLLLVAVRTAVIASAATVLFVPDWAAVVRGGDKTSHYCLVTTDDLACWGSCGIPVDSEYGEDVSGPTARRKTPTYRLTYVHPTGATWRACETREGGDRWSGG
jgi:hypothetical protein